MTITGSFTIQKQSIYITASLFDSCLMLQAITVWC